MGGTKNFATKGDFRYRTIGTIAGIKVVMGAEGTGLHNLPKFAGESIIYIKPDYRELKESNRIVAKGIRLYLRHKGAIDIEWEHKHKNPTKHGKVFKKGEIHVHKLKADGSHSKIARKPSKFEKALAEKVRTHGGYKYDGGFGRNNKAKTK